MVVLEGSVENKKEKKKEKERRKRKEGTRRY